MNTMLKPKVSPGESWIVPFRTSGTKPPLFCACAGGGDVFEYRDFAHALPGDQPVYAFGLPALAEEVQFPTVEQLAAIYVRKIREMQERGPYQLCGHSFGGLVVYEMATQLAEEGEEVGLLALIDTLHPRYSKNLSTLQKVKFHITYYSDRLTKNGRNLLNLRVDKIMSDVFQFGYHRTKKLVWGISRVVFSKQGRRIPNRIRSDALVLAAAWRRYVPRPYHGHLLLLNALERASEYGADRTLGWKTCATRAIAIHIVPGNHYTIMHPPHVRALIERLTPYLSPPRAAN